MKIRELLASTAGSGNLDFSVVGHLQKGLERTWLLGKELERERTKETALNSKCLTRAEALKHLRIIRLKNAKVKDYVIYLKLSRYVTLPARDV